MTLLDFYTQKLANTSCRHHQEAEFSHVSAIPTMAYKEGSREWLPTTQLDSPSMVNKYFHTWSIVVIFKRFKDNPNKLPR
jgi:hypothetical protein